MENLFSILALTKPATTQEIETVTVKPVLSHHYKLAEQAYSGTSFSPERRAESTIKEHSNLLTADLAQVPDNYKEKYQSKFEGFFTAWLHSKSRCMSSMITGPARFPVARMQKYNQWEDNKYNEFMAWRKRILAALARSERKRKQGSELEQAIKNLEGRKKLQETMKKANAIIRKHKGANTCIPECVALGIDAGDIRKMLNPAYSFQNKGFQTFELSNNNANIKRLEDRVKQLQAKEAVKAQIEDGVKEMPEITINGVIILQDFTDDRIKLFFDGKPADNVRASLKSSGFRWSPFLKCWCRKLTNNATYVAKLICTNDVAPLVVTN